MPYVALYESVPTDKPDGRPCYIEVDVKGRIIVSPSGGGSGSTHAFSYFGSTQQTVVASTAILAYIACTNLDTATVWLQAYNDAILIFEWEVIGGAQINVGVDLLNGFEFSTSIVIAVSTTNGSYVAPADASQYNFQGIYIQ